MRYLILLLVFLNITISLTLRAEARSDDWWKTNNEICRMENRVDAPMTFCYASSGGTATGTEWISAEGEITQTTPDEFIKWLDEASLNFQITVYFNSRGGNLFGGLRLGGIIRNRFYNTGIGTTTPEEAVTNLERLDPGRCASSCAYAFLGGIYRSFQQGDFYGVHQFYDRRAIDAIESPERLVATYQDLSTTQAMMGTVIAYIDQMGANPRLAALAAATSPISGSGIRQITVAEARGIDVINSLSDEPFGLTHVGGVLTAHSIGYYLNNPIVRRIQCRNDSMVVFVSTPSGANVENHDGVSIRINLGDFERIGTFHVLGSRTYENKPYKAYYIQIPISISEWPKIRHIAFSETWPFSHANQSIDIAFGMLFEDPEVLALIGRNCM